MQIQGYFDLKFEALKDAFAALFEDPQERGAALCVQIAGETVLDIWAGVADKDGQQAWHSDTILNLFSCTKPFTAVTALQLVGEGKLELDAPVARYWPEFAAAGKEKITLRHLLCHQAGLPALHPQLPAEALYDWQTMTRALAAGGMPVPLTLLFKDAKGVESKVDVTVTVATTAPNAAPSGAVMPANQHKH